MNKRLGKLLDFREYTCLKDHKMNRYDGVSKRDFLWKKNKYGVPLIKFDDFIYLENNVPVKLPLPFKKQ